MFKNRSLQFKTLLFICSVVALLNVGSIAFISFHTSKMAEKNAFAFAQELAQKNSHSIENRLNAAVVTARSLANVLKGMRMDSDAPDRMQAILEMKMLLEDTPEVAGIWTVWEPNAFDGKDADFIGFDAAHDQTGRLVAYWNNIGGIHVEACVSYEDDNPDSGYYTIARDNREEIVMPPFAYEIAGKQTTVVSYCVPIIVNGKVLGVAGVDFTIDQFAEIIQSIRPFETGYATLISQAGTYLAHPNREKTNRDVTEVSDFSNQLVGQLVKGMQESGYYQSEINGERVITTFTPIQLGRAKDVWSLGVSLPLKAILKDSRHLMLLNIFILVISIGILVVVIFLITRNIVVKPVKAVVESLKDIAQGEGDLTVRLEAQNHDEIGELVQWFNTFLEKLQNLVKSIASDTGKVSGASKQLLGISDQLSDGAGNVSNQSSTVAAAGEQLSVNIDGISSGTEEMSMTLRSIATAVEELSSSMNEVARNCEKEAMIAKEADESVKKTQSIMNELGSSAQQIGAIIQVINGIADQTNLLALNATIEAASAGEAGKGFGVVASEVKELARQSAQAAEEIRSQVESMQKKTVNSVTAIEEIATTIEEVYSISTTISAAVEEQSATTNEVSKNINQTNDAANEISSNVQQASSVAGEVSQSIQNISGSAEMTATLASDTHQNAQSLTELADDLKRIVDQFKV